MDLFSKFWLFGLLEKYIYIYICGIYTEKNVIIFSLNIAVDIVEIKEAFGEINS